MAGSDFEFLGRARLPNDLDSIAIERYFTLSADELEQVLLSRTASGRLGLGVQIGCLKALGKPGPTTGRIQPEVLRFVADQVGCPAPDIAGLRSLYPRQATLYQHRDAAIGMAGFRPMGPGARRAYVGYLNQIAAHATVPAEVRMQGLIWLARARYIPLAAKEMDQIHRRAWRSRLEDLEGTIVASAPAHGDWVDELTMRPSGGRTVLEWLMAGPKSRTISALEDEVAKVGVLRRLGACRVDLLGAPDAVVAAHARRITKVRPSRIGRLTAPGRTVALACYLTWELRRRLDLCVELLSFVVADLQRRARDQAGRDLERSGPMAARRHAELVSELDRLAEDDGPSAEDLRIALRRLVDAHRSATSPPVALRADHAMIESVAVDTHGVTHVSMALAKLMGFDICPRYAGLADKKLYVFPDTKVPKALEPITSRTLSRRAIATGWDGLCRLAASTKGGWCPANWALRRMGSAAQGDPTHRAADHLGKLLRTIYLCDYLTNHAFRREIETLLARGEAVHPLQRALHDGALRPRRGRTMDQLKGVSGALTLLTNIVITWNAMRFDEILKDPTFTHPHEHMAHIAPISFRHINLRGVFTFDLGRLRKSQNSGAKTAAKSPVAQHPD